ncbi:class I SAM-dependent methyltransferase [Embleya sp. NPDC020886]|uniref:class I SAM-dependent methyltransferase n=2 Tax=unclassified Embleya TaxID=2699296 RepID=UPI0037B4287D
MTRMREGHHGEGPGAFTPDGCAVQMYERMTVGDEPETIALGARSGARTLLELGSGAGRVTHALVERGWSVTAVDESPEMLARVRGARTVAAGIEELRLDERFDVVLLASYLVNTAEAQACRALLDTCRAHVADDGVVLIQREGAGWHENVPRVREYPGGAVHMLGSEPIDGDETLRAVRMLYEYPDARWVHEFRSRVFTEAGFADLLAGSGLAVEDLLDEAGTWVRAVPVH